MFEFLVLLEIQMLPRWFMSGKPCWEKSINKSLWIFCQQENIVYIILKAQIYSWLDWFHAPCYGVLCHFQERCTLCTVITILKGSAWISYSQSAKQFNKTNAQLSWRITSWVSSWLETELLRSSRAGNADKKSKIVKFIAAKEISLDFSLKAVKSPKNHLNHLKKACV